MIVTTKSGGAGTCNVTFKGYHIATIGPMKESAVWVCVKLLTRSKYLRFLKLKDLNLLSSRLQE